MIQPRPALLAALTALFASACSLCAHESPEHEIEALTARISAGGKTADLLARRAVEWRALGKLKEAADDLRDAIALSGGSVALFSDLARIEAARGQKAVALAAVDNARKLVADVDAGAIYMLRAEILQTQGELASALAECEKAFAHSAPAPDWYLTRARLQSRNGKSQECVAGLQEGFEKTGSIVLEIEWIEALIDAGKFSAAVERIKPYLRRGRWKSGWLIRQARAQIGLGDEAGAKLALDRALAELEARIAASGPEMALIAERGLAHALLGHRAAARQDLALLKTQGGPFSSSVDRLERALSR